MTRRLSRLGFFCATALALVLLAGCAHRNDGDQDKSGGFYGGVLGGWSSR